MSPRISLGPGAEDGRQQVLWKDGERVLYRGLRADGTRAPHSVLALRLIAKSPSPASLDRLAHEYGLKDHLESAWAARPLELLRDRDGTMLVLEDPGGETLDRRLAEPMEVPQFLPLAVAIAVALGRMHQRGLVHKDLKPAHILVNESNEQVRLTGFGLASRLPRERQPPVPPEFIAGTLAYMAPEQTGRMNRSIDSRSDLYALGVIFYQMLTGVLPFTGSDPMEWVHCHIARTPAPPHERVANIPGPISQIVTKLLAKTAEERYQTAAGLAHDLRRCLAEWLASGRIEPFVPGEIDAPDRLSTPQKLYGREREIAGLLAAYNRVATTGTPELMLISGYSGIGKSSVVNELHKALVPSRGLFASGKFDEHRRDIPYATIAQAFQGLIRGFLSKSDVELEGWRCELSGALGAHGRRVLELVPELKLIIGEQPPTPDLPPQQARRLYQIALAGFIGVFAKPEHPLVLFLDDLHWVDAATLDLLEDLMIRPDLRHLLVIGAYRNNEIDPAHPLMRKLEAIRGAGAKVGQITLTPLGREHLEQFVVDALRCAPAKAVPLAQLVHEKTGGNPFFAIRFLSTLADEGLVAFDPTAGAWSWDLDHIRAKEYTENVVELMVAKLGQLPAETQAALRQLACLGNNAKTAMLSTVLATSEDHVHAVLWEAARHELIERLDNSYRFIHDRVREAAYVSIPDRQRAEAHLKIGRLMTARTPAEKRDETILEIVNQLNRGLGLITSGDEREQLAEFNLMAGRRANASTAFASALRYFTTGRELLADDCWGRRRELAFALEFHRAECELLTGALSDAEKHLAALSARATDTTDLADVARLQIDLYLVLNQSSRAVAVGLDYLRYLGIGWSPHPTDEEARRAYDRTWLELDRRATEELIAGPLMTDPASLATLDVLNRLCSPAQYSDLNLYTLAICQMLALTLDRGNSDASTVAYARLGMIAGFRFGEYERAYRVGQLACELVEQRGLRRFEAGVYLNFGNMGMPWTRHIRICCEFIGRAFEAARNAGDQVYANVCSVMMIVNLLSAGGSLADIKREAESALAFAQKVQFGSAIEVIGVALARVRMLLGATARFGSLDDEQFDERRMERDFADTPDAAQCWYWVCKLQARFMAGDYVAALDAASRAGRQLSMSFTIMEAADYHFYSALSYAASCNALPAAQRVQMVGNLTSHHRQLASWAEACPENFEDRASTVGAEIARLAGRELEAEQLYDQAIRSSHVNGFVQNEALANELAARFYAARGFEKIANVYLRDARHGYARWGADGKVRQLDQLYPHINKEEAGPVDTIVAPVKYLDFATVMKISQAVSGEMIQEKLTDALMRTAIEHAGAQRGLLILAQGADYRIEAEAITRGNTMTVNPRQASVTAADLPESILRYVVRTKETVLLNDALRANIFSGDEYIQRQRARSILCMPLLKQNRLIGALYLENNLAPDAFTSDRLAILSLLASQAAISLENTRLYSDLQEREARIRRLVDSNIIGIFVWDLDGRIIDANEAFLRIVGYGRDDLVSGRLRWRDLTPAEWRDADDRCLAELEATGTTQPYEKEYFLKSGSRVPVLVGAATFGGRRDQGVAFVVDLTERERAEEEIRESGRRYSEVQMELVHANRVATMGQLSASIAHEINQPVAAAVNNASAALRWLGKEPPDLEQARQALNRIFANVNRVGEVIGRMHALFKKAPLRKEEVDINGAILEVIALTRGEVVKNDISVQSHLVEGLPLIQGDRVQLQQVILNLIINAVEGLSSVSERSRELVITTGKGEPNGVLVVVRDSGPGLSSLDLERIFEAFYTTKPGGLGMGLSICRSIIEAHGGRLWATAAQPQGATFQFTLPAQSSQAA
jgi:PAS domain S-box-containing protein